MNVLSNSNKVGFAVSKTALTPTFVFQTTTPVVLMVQPYRYLYEETGVSTSSYSGLFVEQGLVGNVSVNSYLTPSLFHRIVTELMGFGYAQTGSGNAMVNTYSTAGNTGKPTIPSHTVGREIAMFFDDGTTGNPIRCTANILSSTITGAEGSMIGTTLAVAVKDPTTSNITFPNSSDETEPNDRYATAATTMTFGASAPVQADVDSWSITFGTGVSALKRKVNNSFRMEGGARSIMVNIASTFNTALRDLWRNTNPTFGNIGITIGNPVTGKPSLVSTISNCVLSERGVNAPMSSVQTESSTWTSAPLGATFAINGFSSSNAPIAT